jgi:hypothetical protein
MRFISTIHRHLIVAVFILLIAAGLSAQTPPPNTREKVEAMRIAFITNRLELTPDQAKLFWPVYNGYRQDLAQLRRSFFPNDEGGNARLDADRQLEFEQRKLDLKKQYKPQFEQILGKAKLNKLVTAEEDFKRLLMQTIRNRHQQRPGGRW